MNLDAIPLFSMLKGRLSYENQREKLIGQNVANASTPGYAPQDLKAFNVSSHLTGSSGGGLAMVQPARTDAAHLAAKPTSSAGGFKVISTVDSETTLDGNKVVLEDQMAKMTESRMQYEAVIGFYQKSLDMIRLAARKPGGG
jgi:flagellar basal-body rod protein FlgB